MRYDRLHKRIHITGAHRSGTTLMFALLVTCFDIDKPIPAEDRLRKPLAQTGRIVCSKCPDESDYAFWLLPLDPNLHVIHMMRDPRDVIVSKFGSEAAPYFTNLYSWRRNHPAPRWAKHPRAHFVRYERLVTEPNRVQEQLAARMPFLRQTRCFSDYAQHAAEVARECELYWDKAMHAIRPADRESIGKWRQRRERVQGQILRHGDLSDELIEMGYEPDRRWLDLLAGVAADLSPSHMPEEERLKSTVTRSWRNAVGAASYVLERWREMRRTRTETAKEPK